MTNSTEKALRDAREALRSALSEALTAEYKHGMASGSARAEQYRMFAKARRDELESLIDAALAHQAEQAEAGVAQWIEIAKRLPEARERPYSVVAIAKKKYSATSSYPGQGIRAVQQDWVIRRWPENFTHWMSLLPEPGNFQKEKFGNSGYEACATCGQTGIDSCGEDCERATPPPSQASEPPQQGEFGDRNRAMDDDELQDFCIACSFDQDDYTVDVIRNVERRMLGQPLFQSSVMSNAEMDGATPPASEAPATAGTWISVEDRLPEEGVTVLVTTDGGVDSIRLDGMQEGCWAEWTECLEHVEVIGGRTSDVNPYTHWAPIPPPCRGA